MKINIIFMGTPEFAKVALEKLDENFNVELIVTQPDRINRRGKKIRYNDVKKYGLENNIEVYQPEDVNSEESINKLASINPDYIVVVAYGQYIGKEVREIPKNNIVNIHASLLPKLRGAAPIHRAILDGEEKTGISIMKVGKGLDKGEVYLVKETEIDDKNLEQLHDELADLGGEGIVEYIKKDSKENIKGKKQDEKKATYAKKVSKKDGYLDFEDVNKEKNKIKGLYPKPGASFKYNDERIKALDGFVYSDNPNEDYEPGTLIDIEEDGILVNCDNGILKITEIQVPGKKKMTVEDYLKGNSFEKFRNLR